MRWIVWGGALSLLVLPALAMQATNAVVWTAYDFAMAALLLVCAGGSYEIAAGGSAWRIGLGVALFALVVLIWADGAVGVF